MSAQVIPFPLMKRVGWINDKLDKASRNCQRRTAKNYLDKRLEDQVETLRRYSVAEDKIESEIASVRHVFNGALKPSSRTRTEQFATHQCH